MNLITYKQALALIKIGGTVAVILPGRAQPYIITKEKGNIRPFESMRHADIYAYGVKIDPNDSNVPWGQQGRPIRPHRSGRGKPSPKTTSCPLTALYNHRHPFNKIGNKK